MNLSDGSGAMNGWDAVTIAAVLLFFLALVAVLAWFANRD